jgi:hypothetical protein
VLAIRAAGEGWLEGGEEARRDWSRRVARLAFQLWGTGELRPDDESEWLSLAAAELFALRAAWAFGAIDYAAYETTLVGAANRCLAGLGGAPVLAAAVQDGHGTAGDCGTVILFVADRAVERAAPGTGGIARLFREMLAEGRLAGGRYGTGLFLGWLDKLAADRELVLTLQRLLRRGVGGRADEMVHALLRQAGTPVTLVAPEEIDGNGAALRLLLRRGLTRCACGTSDPTSAGDADCARFAPRHRLASVGGIDPGEEPAAAYARLQASVRLAQPLEVATGEEASRVTLLCPRDSLEPSLTRLLRLERGS